MFVVVCVQISYATCLGGFRNFVCADRHQGFTEVKGWAPAVRKMSLCQERASHRPALHVIATMYILPLGLRGWDLWCDLSIPASVPILALQQTHPFSRRKLEGAGASMWSRSSSGLATVAPCNKTLGQHWCAAAVSRITWWKCVGTFWWQ